jgi:hypothetical protein
MGLVTTRFSRRIGLLIGGLMALVPLAMQPLPAAAASSGTLYSIGSSGFLLQVDPTTGALTPVVDLNASGLTPGMFNNFGNMTTDSRSQRLFVERTIEDDTVDPATLEHQILTITPAAGTVTVSQDLGQQLRENLAFDSSTSSLFGITQCCPNQLVRIDPVSGTETAVVDLVGDTFSTMAIDQSTHVLYVMSITQTSVPPPTQLLTVDTQANTVGTGGVLNRGVPGLVFDPSPGTLIGATFCCQDSFIVKIDPQTGAETTITEITGSFLEPSSATIDPASHTVYVLNVTFDLNPGGASHVMSINDQTGASTSGAATTEFLGSLAFLPALVTITPDSIKADVRSAVASGAIKGRGLAKSLLAKLDEAAEARAHGHCKAAANSYAAFIKEVRAESGKHIALPTATQLVSEAQFLIANCP